MIAITEVAALIDASTWVQKKTVLLAGTLAQTEKHVLEIIAARTGHGDAAMIAAILHGKNAKWGRRATPVCQRITVILNRINAHASSMGIAATTIDAQWIYALKENASIVPFLNAANMILSAMMAIPKLQTIVILKVIDASTPV